MEEQNPTSYNDIKAAVRVLAILYKANILRGRGGGGGGGDRGGGKGRSLPLTEFYNSAVNEEFERPRDEEEDEEEEEDEDEESRQLRRQRRNFLHLVRPSSSHPPTHLPTPFSLIP